MSMFHAESSKIRITVFVVAAAVVVGAVFVDDDDGVVPFCRRCAAGPIGDDFHVCRYGAACMHRPSTANCTNVNAQSVQGDEMKHLLPASTAWPPRVAMLVANAMMAGMA
jgi:hypothetical protein